VPESVKVAAAELEELEELEEATELVDETELALLEEDELLLLPPPQPANASVTAMAARPEPRQNPEKPLIDFITVPLNDPEILIPTAAEALLPRPDAHGSMAS